MKEKLKRYRYAILGGIAVFILIIVAVVSATVFAGYKKVEKTVELIQPIHKEEVKKLVNENISEETKTNLKEHWLIAGFGLDSREVDIESGGNSDVIMVASINNKTGEIKLVSVYRDTCLKTGKNRYKKANEAYAYGGPQQAVAMLNENLDLQIDDYIAVNWKAVATAINILGGVDMDITKSEFRYINAYITETVNSTGLGSVQLKEPGFQHLDGIQAVAYSRIRFTEGNDFKRTERQRDVIKAVLEKAKKADPKTLDILVQSVFPMVASSIDMSDIMEASTGILKYHFTESTGFPFEQEIATREGASYVFPVTLESNVSELHKFLFGTEDYKVSDAVSEISKKVNDKYKYGRTGIKSETRPEESIPETEPEDESTINPENETGTESLVNEKAEPEMIIITEPGPEPEPETEPETKGIGPGYAPTGEYVQSDGPDIKVEHVGPGYESIDNQN